MKCVKISIFILSLSLSADAQVKDTSLTLPRLRLDFPVLDFSYLQHSASMQAIKRSNELSDCNCPENTGDYFRAYESVSMRQALALTQNLHGTNYYFNNALWNKWIKPTSTKKKILNRIAANVSAGAIDYVLAYQFMLFSPVWLHEEFHRTGMTIRGISSHDNAVNVVFGGIEPAGGSITEVRDEDLARFKAVAPQEMVRSFAAGTESEYLLLRNMQKDNFYYRTNYPNVLLHILLTKHAIDYVNQFKEADFDQMIIDGDAKEHTIRQRDFVGWDFTPWVYDLFRPIEPYAARGTHPTGVGIDRQIKTSDLTGEEYDYLAKMGRLQYLNMITPFMVGINRIRWNQNTTFNFALRHFLTSFGSDITADFFLDRKGKQFMFTFHGYQNKDHFFPGVEVEYPIHEFSLGARKMPVYSRAMMWLQPNKQNFYTNKGAIGGLLQLKVEFPFNKIWSVYAETESKTQGWVAGNPYLKANASFRMGLALDIKKSMK